MTNTVPVYACDIHAHSLLHSMASHVHPIHMHLACVLDVLVKIGILHSGFSNDWYVEWEIPRRQLGRMHANLFQPQVPLACSFAGLVYTSRACELIIMHAPS